MKKLVIRKHLGVTFHELAKRKGVIIEEGHLMKDLVRMCISIPPKLIRIRYEHSTKTL